jgi:hypothetical protein
MLQAAMAPQTPLPLESAALLPDARREQRAKGVEPGTQTSDHGVSDDPEIRKPLNPKKRKSAVSCTTVKPLG